MIRFALAFILAAALPALAQVDDFDPALWQPITQWFVPVNNTSGIDGTDGTNTPGNGRLGKGDIAYWSWNLPGDPYPQRAPFVWNPADVTKTWWGASTGIPASVKAAWIHVQVIMTPGTYPYSGPTMSYQFRGAGTLEIDPAKTPSVIVGARLPDTLLVPVKDGKIEFRYRPTPYPQPPYSYDPKIGPTGGSTYSQHIIVLSPGR